MAITRKSILRPRRGDSLSNRIVAEVLEALFSKRVRPGEFLGTEAQLAEMFETSRVPVREALGRLEALGVIEIKTGAQGGATIATGDPTQFATALAIQFMLANVTAREIFDARIAIESMAAELAAANATPQDIERLRAIVAEMKKRSIGGADTVKLIHEFHLAVVEASKTRTLITLMRALLHALFNHLEDLPPTVGRSPALRLSMVELLTKIEEHDAPGAHRVMREMLLRARDSVIKLNEDIERRKSRSKGKAARQEDAVDARSGSRVSLLTGWAGVNQDK